MNSIIPCIEHNWIVDGFRDNLYCVGPDVTCYLWDNPINFSILPESEQKKSSKYAYLGYCSDEDTYNLRITINNSKIRNNILAKEVSALITHEVIHVIQVRDGTKNSAKLNYANNKPRELFSLEFYAQFNQITDGFKRLKRKTDIPSLQDEYIDKLQYKLLCLYNDAYLSEKNILSIYKISLRDTFITTE